MNADEAAGILARYREILARLGSARLIAVSKTHPIEKIAVLYRAGQRDFGENYVQEMLGKAEQARDLGFTDIRWHFIGHLQTNKVKLLLPAVDTIHGITSEKLALEIQKRAAALGRKVRGLIEVNVDEQESKSGVRIAELRKLAEAVGQCSQIELRGLMCIPDPDRPGGTRAAFHQLASLEASLRPLTHGELSMGMTSDFVDALAEGATYVRIGTAIFGDREKKRE